MKVLPGRPIVHIDTRHSARIHPETSAYQTIMKSFSIRGWVSARSLSARVMFLAAFVLGSSLLASIHFGLKLSSRQALEQLQTQGQVKLGLIADAIASQPEITGSEVQRTLLQARMAHGDLNYLSLTNLQGRRLEYRRPPETGERPDWFARLAGMHTTGLTLPIYRQGMYTGTLSIEANAMYQENLLWRQTLNQAGWSLLAMMVMLWLLSRILRANLAGLRHLQQAAQRMVEDGETTQVVAPRHAPPELKKAVDAFNDMANRQSKLLQKLEHQAREDALTGLPNRRALESALEEACADADCTYAFCYIDLDQFKLVNDTCGHHAGDRMLRELIQMLGNFTAGKGKLFRVGGDEFGLLARDASLERMLMLCDELIEIINVYRFRHEDRFFRVGASVGLTLFGKGHPRIDPSEVMVRADKACYTAKNLGRNRFQIYQDSDSDMRALEVEMDWITEINAALDENRMMLYRQAIQPLQGGNPAHHEMLVRLRKRDGQIVNPGQFLPAAERYGTITAIDRWVLDTTLDYLSNNQHRQELCNINLSGASFSDPGFLSHAIEQIGRHQAAQRICFEITETAAISRLDDARQFIRMLGGMGCQFALDDFGSGMSSFAYLKELPVNSIKISGDFVRNIASNRHDYVFVSTMTRLAHDLNLRCVAEFVQDQDILDRLREIGVDYAQGFHLHKPEPVCNTCRQLRYCTHPMSKNFKRLELVAA